MCLHTLTCSFEVTAQKTISVNPWVGNILKQIPPITRPSLIRAKVLCFLRPHRGEEGKGRLMRHETWQLKVEESNRRSGKRKGSLWTYGSNTRRVMYSLGMRGSWWEKTFCRPTSHIRIFLLDFWERELPMTWNSMMPLLSSRRAVSSRAAFADNRLVWETSKQIIFHETRRLFKFINHKIQDVLIHNGRTSCYI